MDQPSRDTEKYSIFHTIFVIQENQLAQKKIKNRVHSDSLAVKPHIIM